MLCPAFFAACSTAAHPPRTIRSASETLFPPDCERLKSCWIRSRVCSTLASSAGSLTCHSFCGARRIRAPLAPPRLSVPRKLAGDAHAGRTRPRGQFGGQHQGAWRLDRTIPTGTGPLASGFLGRPLFAPAGVVGRTQSFLDRFLRNPLAHRVGASVHAPSSPLV